ncbi:MAG: DUF3108 domain-containing protein [Candidatus Omnitrophica bacterium]|nr:DUF3108 domain-containing protein [Candidatus Omnitrophota bacterium]
MKKVGMVFLVFLGLLVMVVLFKNLGQRRILRQLVSADMAKIKELHYRLNMLGLIPVGEAVIFRERQEEYDGRKVYHLRAAAFSGKVISIFFSAKAEVDSFVSMDDLNPVMFKQKLFVKNKYDTEKEVYYDQKQGVMTLAGVSRIIPIGTKDPLSAMFFLRRMDAQAIKDFEFNINTNQKTYVLKGAAQIQDESIDGKPCQLIRLRADIRRRDKNPYHKSSIAMLLLRVSENIPFKINVLAGGVYLEAVLIGVR